MLIKQQPMEAYFCLLYPSEHGNLCSTVPVEGPLSASPFSDEYGGIDLVSPSPYLVRAHNLIYPCTCHGLLKMHDVCSKFADQEKLQCMYEILTPPCTYGIPLTGLLA